MKIWRLTALIINILENGAEPCSLIVDIHDIIQTNHCQYIRLLIFRLSQKNHPKRVCVNLKLKVFQLFRILAGLGPVSRKSR